MGRKIMAAFLAVTVVVMYSFAGVPIVSADEGTEGGGSPTGGETVKYEAQIGSVKYEKLISALNAAKDNEIIELLSNCELNITGEYNIDDNVTIKGSYTIYMKTGRLNINRGKTLTLQNCNVKIYGDPEIPSPNFYVICISKGGDLQLEGACLEIGTDNAVNLHGIYCCGDNVIDMQGSTMELRNLGQDAIEWDGANNGFYKFNCINSVFLSDTCRSGFTGTIDVTAFNSTIKVLNSMGNGSNGSNFCFTDSKVFFLNSGAHGISAGILQLVNSQLTASENGFNGIVGRNIKINKDSQVYVSKNTDKGSEGAFRVLGNAGHCVIDAGAQVKIEDNYRSGIYIDSPQGSMEMHSGFVVNNGKSNAVFGGGLYNKGAFRMDGNSLICNNHAAEAGDDIYNTGSVTLTDVGGRNLILDDDNQEITGWFYDGSVKESVQVAAVDAATLPVPTGNRWNVSATTGNSDIPDYYEEYTTVNECTEPIALKAAHPYIEKKDPAPDPDKKVIGAKVESGAPQTGDEAGLYLFMLLAAVAAGCGAFTLRQRSN